MTLADNPLVAELVLKLWDAPDREAGLVFAELPDHLRDENLISACEGAALIRLARRNHCWHGGPIAKLVLEEGWNIADLRKPNRKNAWQILRESANETVPDDIRLHVQLGPEGTKLGRQLALTRSALSCSDSPKQGDQYTDRNHAEIKTAGDLWKVLDEGWKPAVVVSAISFGPRLGPNIAQPKFPKPDDQSTWDVLDRALALCDAEGGDRAEAMRMLVARIALAKGVDRREVVNMTLAEFVMKAGANGAKITSSDPPGGGDAPAKGKAEGFNCDVPQADKHDDRVAWWIGKRIYLGRDTQVARLFWLLAKSVGRAHSLGELQRTVEGMETNADTGSRPDEIKKAGKRLQKVLTKLRAAMREAELDSNFVIHRGGTQNEPEYSLIPRFPQKGSVVPIDE